MRLLRERLYTFRGLMLAAVGFVTLALLAIGYTVWKLRSDAIDDAFRDGGNLASVLAEQTAQTVRSIDLILGDVQERILLLGVRSPDDLRRELATEHGHALLKSRIDRFPQADILTVVDAAGFLVSNSRVWSTRRLDYSDRDYFEHFKRGRDASTYISFPVTNRTTGTPTVFFSRPIRDAEGTLLGVVAIGIPIARFRAIYETVGLVGNQAFMFARADGTILVRYPDTQDRLGQKVPPDSPWYDAVARGGGTFRSKGRFDQETVRLVTLRMIPGYPLAVAVGVSQTAALAVWQERSTSIAIGTLLALICSSFLLVAVSNRVRLLKISEASLAEQKEALAGKTRELEAAREQTDAAINNITQGISMFDAGERLLVCNRRYLEIYGLSPDAVKPGCTLRDILDYRKSLGSYDGEPSRHAADSAARILQGEKFSHTATLPDGRIISVVTNPTSGGGWVATQEDITERHRVDALIAHMARHDPLTDLPNRLVFEQKMDEALLRLNRQDASFALLLLDLDRFKAVNDGLGHPVGDALLKAVAERLLPCVHELDTVTRLGGDEFAILQTHVDDPEQSARVLGNRLLDAIGEPFMLGEQRVQVGLSIGIALAPRDGSDMDGLVKNADLALYRAKESGRNRLRFFDHAIDTAATPPQENLRVA